MPEGYSVNPRRDKNGLTAKQKEFAEKALTMPQGQAAREVFPDHVQPDATASKLMKNEKVSSYMSHLLNEKGASRDTCAKNIADKIKSRDDRSSLKATEMALEIHGELNRKSESSAVPITKELFIDLCATFWGTKPA